MNFLKNENGFKFFYISFNPERTLFFWFSTSHYHSSKKDFDPDLEKAEFFSFLATKGVKIESSVELKQIHGNRVVVVKDDLCYKEDSGELENGDALITNLESKPLVIKVADCLSVQLHDPVSGSIANIHCGWRSGAQNILALTIEKMAAVFNSHPLDIRASLMPSISSSNYQVGEDVYSAYTNSFKGMDRFFQPDGNGTWRFSLRGAAVKLLCDSGIAVKNITDLNLCTFEEKDLFYSYRRDGKATGRMFAVITKMQAEH